MFLALSIDSAHVTVGDKVYLADYVVLLFSAIYVTFRLYIRSKTKTLSRLAIVS